MQTPPNPLYQLVYHCFISVYRITNTILRRQESKSKTKVFSQKSDMHAIVCIVNFQMMPPLLNHFETTMYFHVEKAI